MVHPRFSGSKNVQSPLANSLRLTRRPTGRVWLSFISPTGCLMNAAICPTSSSLTQTKPSGPVQQLPHWVHLNFRPPLYHFSSFMPTDCKLAGWSLQSRAVIGDAPIEKACRPSEERPYARLDFSS